MCFPDESYDYDAMCKNSIFIGAYDGDICIGLAIMQHAFFEYMYDLKVNAEYRKEALQNDCWIKPGRLLWLKSISASIRRGRITI